MNITKFIKKLEKFPPDTEVEVEGFQAGRPSLYNDNYDRGTSKKIKFEYAKKKKTLEIEGDLSSQK